MMMKSLIFDGFFTWYYDFSFKLMNRNQKLKKDLKINN